MKPIALLLGIGVFLGCRGSETGPNGDAKIQFLQADPSAPATVSFSIDNSVVDHSVAYGQSSSRVLASAGTHRLAIESLNGVEAELTATLAAGTSYFLVHSAGELFLTEGASMTVNGEAVPPDTGQRDPLRAHIRFVNIPGATDEPPFRVDALVTSPSTVDTTFQIGLDTRIASYGTLIYLNPGSVTVRVRPEGLPTVLAEETFAVALGEVKALVLERDSNFNLRLRVVVEQ